MDTDQSDFDQIMTTVYEKVPWKSFVNKSNKHLIKILKVTLFCYLIL